MPVEIFWCWAWKTNTPARHGRRAGWDKCFLDLSRVFIFGVFNEIRLCAFLAPTTLLYFLIADNRGTKKGCIFILRKGCMERVNVTI